MEDDEETVQAVEADLAEIKAKVEQLMAEKTKALTAGLPIPPGMKFPF